MTIDPERPSGRLAFIMRGVSGAGKTTMGVALARRLNVWPQGLVSSDAYRWAARLGTGCTHAPMPIERPVPECAPGQILVFVLEAPGDTMLAPACVFPDPQPGGTR